MNNKEPVGIYQGDPLKGGVFVDCVEAPLHYSRYHVFGPAQTIYIRYRGRWLRVKRLEVPGRSWPMYSAQAGDWYTDHKERRSTSK